MGVFLFCDFYLASREEIYFNANTNPGIMMMRNRIMEDAT